PPSYVDLVFKIPTPEKSEEPAVTPENKDNTETTEAITENIENTAAVDTIKNEVVNDTVQKTIENEVSAVEQNKKQEKKGLLALFLFCFGGGLLALFTPCVFPMVPMTVSFFTKQSKTKAQG